VTLQGEASKSRDANSRVVFIMRESTLHPKKLFTGSNHMGTTRWRSRWTPWKRQNHLLGRGSVLLAAIKEGRR
jgi:hypothetical protein